MGWISPNFITILVVLGVSATVCFFDLIQSDLAVFTFVLAGWVASVCLHEFGHAVAAWYGGDRSVAHKGYLNLDPVQYVDPVNSILLPVVVLALGGIGLPGAAVYIETRFIRSAWWLSFTAAAGPLMNLALLVVLALPFMLGLDLWGGGTRFWAALAMLAFLQATSVMFNLLPVPGFDGYGIIEPFLPDSIVQRIHPWRFVAPAIVLVALLAIPDFGRAIIDKAGAMTMTAGVPPFRIYEGFGRFRFWKRLGALDGSVSFALDRAASDRTPSV